MHGIMVSLFFPVQNVFKVVNLQKSPVRIQPNPTEKSGPNPTESNRKVRSESNITHVICFYNLFINPISLLYS